MMKARENHIEVKKTARYYTFGNRSAGVVWVVFHGYGMPAGDFIRSFEVFGKEGIRVIAPEGLSRFYLDGVSGKVGASWMTKEDRLNEIRDQADYLDRLYDQEIAGSAHQKVTAFGFSQGVATMVRWLENTACAVNEIICYTGSLPGDVDYQSGVFKELPWTFCYASGDNFISGSQVEEEKNIIKDRGMHAKFIHFEGKHRIYPDVLKQIAKLG